MKVNGGVRNYTAESLDFRDIRWLVVVRQEWKILNFEDYDESLKESD